MGIIVIIATIVVVLLIIRQYKEFSKDAVPKVNKDDKFCAAKDEYKELKFFCVKDKGYHVSVWPKNVDDFDIVRFTIAGITYHKDVAMRRLGETLGVLVAEPDNPHDSNAIRIMTPNWECVGYVPKDVTSEVRRLAGLPCPCLFYIGYIDEEDLFYTCAYVRLDMLNRK